MNRLGMMVDISHVADKTFYDALEVSVAPVIASHSSTRALASAPRNMTDDMLRALAKKNGVVHINFFEGFLDDGFRKRFGELKQEQAEQDKIEAAMPKFGDRARGAAEVRKLNQQRIAKVGRIPLSRLLDHFDHAIKIAGIDHVGLGSDFDGVSGATPAGIDSAADLPKITQALLDRGYSADDIRKILGGNLLRVFREAEKVSHEMQAGK